LSRLFSLEKEKEALEKMVRNLMEENQLLRTSLSDKRRSQESRRFSPTEESLGSQIESPKFASASSGEGRAFEFMRGFTRNKYIISLLYENSVANPTRKSY
jgi:hypothetical protein